MKDIITINTTNASETIGFWVQNMILEEIEDTKDTIENEELWVAGSANEEEAEMHRNNIEMLKEYLSIMEATAKDFE